MAIGQYSLWNMMDNIKLYVFLNLIKRWKFMCGRQWDVFEVLMLKGDMFHCPPPAKVTEEEVKLAWEVYLQYMKEKE